MNLVVDTGSRLPGRKVVVPREKLGEAHWNARTLLVKMPEDKIRNGPRISQNKPVSVQMEELKKTYNNSLTPKENPFLRSVGEILGYQIQARNGEIGHVEDFVADDTHWVIRYLVVDTRNWLPGKKVLITASWFEQIDWGESKFYLN